MIGLGISPAKINRPKNAIYPRAKHHLSPQGGKKISKPQAFLAAWLFVAALAPAIARAGEVQSGLDVLVDQKFQELKGKRIGLVTNQTAKTRRGQSIVDVLAGTSTIKLAALFSPEHGFAGTLEDANVSSGTYKLPDGRTIPLYSLYGSTQAPTSDMLSGLDVLMFDIQDVGSRFYTYATTMGMAMEAATAAHMDFYVLDRPNPIRGDITEGPILVPAIRHFTAYFSIPVRHGLTMGEIARFHNIVAAVGANLHVVPLKGWSRDMWFDQTGLPWVQPSPNMPDLESAILYPGIGCFEASNLSVGRGTPIPFRWIGAPWMNAKAILKRLKQAKLAGFKLDAENYTPKKSAYKGKKCRGIRIRIKDRDAARPLELFAYLICALRDIQPMEFGIDWPGMSRMTGTEEFRKLYASGAGPGKMIEFFHSESRRFEATRGAFLLY